MHIKHNTCIADGVTFEQMQIGEAYIRLRDRSKPHVYIACRRPGHACGAAPDFLVNLSTGTLCNPARDIRFKHLPDATLDTGA